MFWAAKKKRAIFAKLQKSAIENELLDDLIFKKFRLRRWPPAAPAGGLRLTAALSRRAGYALARHGASRASSASIYLCIVNW